MELEKIVLLPIPTGWRDSNSPMGDGLSKLNGFFQLHHSWDALFCVRIEFSSDNVSCRSISHFWLTYFVTTH